MELQRGDGLTLGLRVVSLRAGRLMGFDGVVLPVGSLLLLRFSLVSGVLLLGLGIVSAVLFSIPSLIIVLLLRPRLQWLLLRAVVWFLLRFVVHKALLGCGSLFKIII